MTSLFFEEPLQLGALLAVVLAILLGLWNRRRTPGSRTALLAGTVAAAALLAIQSWVITDREQLMRTVRQLSAYVEGGDVAGIVGLCDPAADFGADYGLEDFEEQLQRLLAKYVIERPEVGGFEISWSDGAAVMRCAAHCRVAFDQGEFPIRSRWELHFQQIGRTWKIVGIRPISIMDRPYDSFFDIN